MKLIYREQVASLVAKMCQYFPCIFMYNATINWTWIDKFIWYLHRANLDSVIHDDVIKWKHFPYYWPFVRGIHQSLVNSPHKGQWRGALMFSLICARINAWVNNRKAGDSRRHLTHYDVIVMSHVLTAGQSWDNFSWNCTFRRILW